MNIQKNFNALINSLKIIFKSIKHNGCYYHFTRAVGEKMKIYIKNHNNLKNKACNLFFLSLINSNMIII